MERVYLESIDWAIERQVAPLAGDEGSEFLV